MWSELIRDCFNADVIVRRVAFLVSIKNESWEDERGAGVCEGWRLRTAL